MARSYTFQYNVTTTTNTAYPLGLLTTGGSATNQYRIYDVLSGSDATPVDQATKFQLIRSSTTGNTLSVQSNFGITPGDPAPTSLSYLMNSGGSTITVAGVVLTWAQNQRATFRWVAAPERELYSPVGAQAGIGLISPVLTAAYNVVISEEFTE